MLPPPPLLPRATVTKQQQRVNRAERLPFTRRMGVDEINDHEHVVGRHEAVVAV